MTSVPAADVRSGQRTLGLDGSQRTVRSVRVEDAGRHRQLADVVEDRHELELEELVGREMQLLADRAAGGGEPVRVVRGAEVVDPQRLDELRDRRLDGRAHAVARTTRGGRAIEQYGDVRGGGLGHRSKAAAAGWGRDRAQRRLAQHRGARMTGLCVSSLPRTAAAWTREMTATGVWSERDTREATADRGRAATESFVNAAVAFIERWKAIRPLAPLAERQQR